MVFDNVLATRLEAQNKGYFSALAPAVRDLGLIEGEAFLDLGQGFAFFAGEGNPLTQAGGPFSVEDLEATSRFYRGRTSCWEAVVTPFAGREALQSILGLDATVQGWENTLYLPYAEWVPESASVSQIEIVEIDEKDLAIWSEISMRGFWSQEISQAVLNLYKIEERATNLRRYLAYWEGKPAAAATLTPGSGIAFLGGMATLPEFRGRGLQMALLQRRLTDGALDSDVAVVGAVPGSPSHRNSERAGFRVAYSQLSLRVPA